MNRLIRVALLVVIALVAASCGGVTIDASNGGEPGEEVRAEHQDSCGTAESLRFGQPAYDYDRTEEIADLVAEVDVVLSGTLQSAVWSPVEDAESGYGSILVTPGEFGPLTPASPEISESAVFEIGANGDDGEPHPLADPLVFEDQTHFVAFAYVTADDPNVMQLHPQGLYLWCDSEDSSGAGSVDAIIEPLPADAANLAFFELVDTISAVAPAKPSRAVGDIVEIEYRVLADGLDVGEPWSAEVIVDAEGLAAAAPGLADEPVDFEREVVFAFNPAESGSCPFGAMEGLEFETLNQVLYPVVPLAEEFDACTDDANPHLILVAVAKEDLPEAPFDVWVNQHEPPSGVVDGVAIYSGDS